MGFGNVGEWQKKQAEIYTSMMQAFMPNMPGGKSSEPAAQAEEPKGESDDVSAIKQQLAELQKKLDSL